MILSFPFAFGGKETAVHVGQGDLFVRMARRFSRGVKIVQMTDMETVEIAGVDECVRSESGELGGWYFRAMAEFPHREFLRVDYDVVVREDVSDLFRHDFDIAIAKERNGHMNNGVVFVKTPEFFDVAAAFYAHHTKRNGWTDIENATQLAIDSGSFKVKKLPPEIYNHIPDGTILPVAQIIHFKGALKSSMSDYRAIEEATA